MAKKENPDNTPENDINDLFGLDIGVEDQKFGSAFPVVQYVIGDATKKKMGGIDYHGGFFVSLEQGLEIPGAEEHTLITQDGTEVKGYAIRDLTISVIRYRRSWLAQASKDSLPVRFPWNAYETAEEIQFEGPPKGRAQLLVMIKGMKDPVTLSLSGTVARAMLGQGKDRGVLPQFASVIVNRAKTLARAEGKNKDYPLCSFWLTVGPERNEKGEPTFTTVGKDDKTSQVAMPVWLDAPVSMPDKALLTRLFVGTALYPILENIHKDGEDWVNQWSAAALVGKLTSGVVEKDALKKLTNAMRGEGATPAAGASLPGSTETPF